MFQSEPRLERHEQSSVSVFDCQHLDFFDRYANKMMVSDELPDGQMIDQWEPIGPDSVQTPLEVQFTSFCMLCVVDWCKTGIIVHCVALQITHIADG